MLATQNTSRVKCGNTAYHGRENVTYHESVAAVRECYANSGRFGATHQKVVEAKGVWHSTGPTAPEGHWEVVCPGSSCPVMSLPSVSVEDAVTQMRASIDWNQAEAAQRAEEERKERARIRYATWRTIPVYTRNRGYYALVMGGVEHFFRVERPATGQHKGKTFVVEQASDTFYKMPFRRAGEVLDAIAVDPEAAALLYGQKIKRCSRCRRTITAEDSRTRGMGPDCAAKEW